MKIVPALLGVAAAALSSLALAAPAMSADTEEVVFAYDLDRDLLATAAGAEAVYNDLVREARAACTLAGSRGFTAVDEVCAAELVDKVVIASGSATLEGQYADSQYAALAIEQIEQAERFAIASR